MCAARARRDSASAPTTGLGAPLTLSSLFKFSFIPEDTAGFSNSDREPNVANSRSLLGMPDEGFVVMQSLMRPRKNRHNADDRQLNLTKTQLYRVFNDPEFKTGVVTVFNNDHDNSSGSGAGKDLAWIETNHGRIFDVAGKKARYVRLLSNGNTANEMNHYVEIEVYGTR